MFSYRRYNYIVVALSLIMNGTRPSHKARIAGFHAYINTMTTPYGNTWHAKTNAINAMISCGTSATKANNYVVANISMWNNEVAVMLRNMSWGY